MSDEFKLDEELVAHLNLAALRMATFELELEAETIDDQPEPAQVRGTATVTGTSPTGTTQVTVSILVIEHPEQGNEGSGEGGPEV